VIGFSSGILKAMQENGVKKADVSMIFLTHGHIDHSAYL
jgi:glyoxylase-like metal-dependent hydrolase (beta-lactamase superfamily II)